MKVCWFSVRPLCFSRHLYQLRGCLSVLGMLLVLSGCGAALERGLTDANAVGSNARPALVMRSTLPLLQAFRGSPQISTPVGYNAPQVWGAVYGTGSPDAPLAIAALSEALSGWQWGLPPIVLAGPEESTVSIGGQNFSATTLMVPTVRDPFTPLVLAAEAPERAWMTRRFTALEDFRQSKIVLEYRELLPEDQSSLPRGAAIEAFNARAQAAFVVSFSAPTSAIVPEPWFGKVDARFFDRFLGKMEPPSRLLEFE